MRRVLLLAAASLACSCALYSPPAAAATYHVHMCGGWSTSPGPLVGVATPGMFAGAELCGSATNGDLLLEMRDLRVAGASNASFIATAPPGLTIAHIFTVNDISWGVGDGQGWGGVFFWDGGPGPNGRSGEITDNFSKYGCCQASLNNQRVGWYITCAWPACTAQAAVEVGGVDLTVAENQGPVLAAPSGIWQAAGWVRGQWPLVFSGDSPSGVCSLAAAINGQPVTLGPSSVVGQNTSAFHQCAGASASPTVQTANYGQGALPLTIEGCDAAGVCTGSAYTKAIYVDDSQPNVTFSGPNDASATAGTQFVTATGSAGPSGVSGLGCSIDGAPYAWHPQASVRIPVGGIGSHRVTCFSANNARDASGHVAISAPRTWSLSIREPTVSAVGFARMVDPELCHRVRERATIHARWVTVRRHHNLIRVRKRARTRLVRVTRCHARLIRRRVTVWETAIRHGRAVHVKRHRTIRVAVFPHVVYHVSKRVAHGRRTTVSGWLGLANGTALAGQRVWVLAAPDDGLGHFSAEAAAVTAEDGAWSARLPAGPSRLVEAYYGGAPTLEPSQSGQVHVVVRAKVKLIGVFPHRVAWGGTIQIVGKLDGGYLPPGGALVRLRIGLGSRYTTYGVQEHVGNGRFSTSYTFGLGDPSVYQSYWFQLATLPIGDYPWAPGASGRRFVLVGGHPPATPPPPRRKRHHPRTRRRR